MIRLLPFLLVSTLHAASARVSWHANPETDIAGYRLRWDGADQPAREIETSATSAAVDELKPGVSYSFRLCAVNTSGMRSGWSEPTSYAVPAQLSEPSVQRIKITIYSSESPSRQNKREEARFFQPITGPRRFWWAEIENP